MTIEIITTMLDRISSDSDYNVIDNHINLTINSFEDFNDNWFDVSRKYIDENAINDVLEWLKENADYIDGNFYHFGDIMVEVGYTSFEI